MTRDEVDTLLGMADANLERDGGEAACWEVLGPLLAAAPTGMEAARGLARVLGDDRLDRERRLEEARRLVEHRPDDLRVLTLLGWASEGLVDRRYLNAPPPADPWFGALADSLLQALDGDLPVATRLQVARALSTVARVSGRRFDPHSERAHAEVLGIQPDSGAAHYNHGLFLKNRGRFAEGLAANQRAASCSEADDESVIWNLGICATGCGEGAVALEVWHKIGAKLALNAHGLPEGTWHSVQVRVAERPVASRGPDTDDPGLEETVWVERLSPCHGRVRSALYQDLGVDYGDLVLFDGAPIVMRHWGDRTVPVFPHLVTLRAGGWDIHLFAATQREEGQIDGLSEDLPGDSVLYVHTERFRLVCRSCWERADPTHSHREVPHRVVTGKLCIPPDQDGVAVADALDGAAAVAGVQVFFPSLRAHTDPARVDVDQRRFDLLMQAGAAST